MILIDNDHDGFSDDEMREQQLLKYLDIIGGGIIVIFAIIAIWFPSLHFVVRVMAITLISFGTIVVVRRKELKRQTTWSVLVVAALIHFLLVWFFRERLFSINMWVLGLGAVLEAVFLQVLIEVFTPSGE